jgi:hypothetical protein
MDDYGGGDEMINKVISSENFIPQKSLLGLD